MHRDLKLPNILVHFPELANNVCQDESFDMKSFLKTVDLVGGVNKSGEEPVHVKIADLGFARKLGEDQLTDTTCGTPLLMAPEVLGGQLYNHKADVWSLGCLFYEMLTGFAPFTGRSQKNLEQNIAKGTYMFPKTLKLSLEGLSFLNSCLRYKHEERIDWQDLLSHPYIAFQEAHQDALQANKETQLYLSYCPKTGDYQQEGAADDAHA